MHHLLDHLDVGRQVRVLRSGPVTAHEHRG